MVGYLGVFFGAGYVALNVVEWAWSAIVR